MMRVLKRKSDARIIESQSGDGDLDVLIQNAEAAGLHAFDVEALVMDDAAFAEAMAEQHAGDMCAADRRRAAYPSVGDQLDALWHAMAAGIVPKVPAFFDPIAQIKLRFPSVD